jgi:hypothetical protein
MEYWHATNIAEEAPCTTNASRLSSKTRRGKAYHTDRDIVSGKYGINPMDVGCKAAWSRNGLRVPEADFWSAGASGPNPGPEKDSVLYHSLRFSSNCLPRPQLVNARRLVVTNVQGGDSRSNFRYATVPSMFVRLWLIDFARATKTVRRVSIAV